MVSGVGLSGVAPSAATGQGGELVGVAELTDVVTGVVLGADGAGDPVQCPHTIIVSPELGELGETGQFGGGGERKRAGRQIEPGEAEWNLEVLEHLFDFYFVELPGRKVRRHALEEKLKEAGRKPLAGT